MSSPRLIQSAVPVRVEQTCERCEDRLRAWFVTFLYQYVLDLQISFGDYKISFLAFRSWSLLVVLWCSVTGLGCNLSTIQNYSSESDIIFMSLSKATV